MPRASPSCCSCSRSLPHATGEVEIPPEIDGLPVVGISHDVFAHTNVTRITIPASVTDVNASAFSFCSTLEAILVAEDNLAFTDHEGVLYDIGMTTVIRCPEGKRGSYSIPEGVTTIGSSAFRRTVLTELSIPASVAEIGWSALDFSSGIETFRVAPASSSFVVHEGVLYDANMTTLLQCPGAKTGFLKIPEGVDSIDSFAFSSCHDLAGIQVPASVTDLKPGAFYDLWSLSSLVFLGDAPNGMLDPIVVTPKAVPAPDLTIYYLNGSTGFTSPIAYGFPSVMIDPENQPNALWLVENGIPHDASLHHDRNGDGVSLLMAYALNLDPTKNLQRSLPQPVVDNSCLALTFHPARAGLTYTVETSTDLKNWTTTGVTRSEPNLDGLVTASVERDVPRRFLRLVVSE